MPPALSDYSTEDSEVELTAPIKPSTIQVSSKFDNTVSTGLNSLKVNLPRGKRRSGLLAGLDSENIIPSDDEGTPLKRSKPSPSYRTRRQVHGSSKSELCYSQKYHPMDDITQPKRAAKMKVHYGDEPPYGDPDLSSYDSDDEADSESESESDTDTEEHSKKEDAKKKKKSKDKGKGKARENNHVVTQGTRRPSRVAHRNVNYDMAVHPQDREIEGIERAEHTAKQRLGKRKSVDKADSDSDDDVDDNDNDTDNSNGYYNGYYNSYSNGYSNGYYNSYNNGYNNGNDGNISDSDTYYDSDKENRDPNAIKQKKPGNGRGDNDLKQIDTDFSDENSDASDFFNDEPSPKSASGRNPLSELLGDVGIGAGIGFVHPSVGFVRANGDRSVYAGYHHQVIRIHEDHDPWPTKKGKRFIIHAESLDAQLKAENAATDPIEYDDDNDKENCPPDEEMELEDPHAGLTVHTADDVRRSGQSFDQENTEQSQQYTGANDLGSEWDSVVGYLSPLATNLDGAGGETERPGPAFANPRTPAGMGAGLNGPGAETQYATTPFAIYEDPVEADQEDTHGAVESTEETQVADESTTE